MTDPTDRDAVQRLAPCPFCGSAAVIRRGMNAFIDVEIGCDTCQFSGPNFGSMDETPTPEADAIAAWNMRHADAQLQAAVEAEREACAKWAEEFSRCMDKATIAAEDAAVRARSDKGVA